jgi:hypothetical protein
MGGAGGVVSWLRSWVLVAHRCHEGPPSMTERPVAAGVEMPSDEVGPIQVRVSPGVCEGWGNITDGPRTSIRSTRTDLSTCT